MSFTQKRLVSCQSRQGEHRESCHTSSTCHKSCNCLMLLKASLKRPWPVFLFVFNALFFIQSSTCRCLTSLCSRVFLMPHATKSSPHLSDSNSFKSEIRLKLGKLFVAHGSCSSMKPSLSEQLRFVWVHQWLQVQTAENCVTWASRLVHLKTATNPIIKGCAHLRRSFRLLLLYL